jgi:diadenosine tetraphosphatase ApaH/serine/threonine PP2A family protein phosphatase
MLERAKRCETLTVPELKLLFKTVIAIVSEEPNVVPMPSPVVIAGDVHGQFYDVMRLFEVAGGCPENRMLFLGDIVDRGYYSVETLTLLLLLKVLYPDRIIILRGNHECRTTSENYGFRDEIVRKFGRTDIWKAACDVFDYLPIAALIDGRAFCVHGGLSPSAPTLDLVRELHRCNEVPLTGPLCDLLWSDPSSAIENWMMSSRLAGYQFGQTACAEFCYINDLDVVFRAHQTAMAGYQSWFEGQMFTVWSAPRYCYRMNNKASVARYAESGEVTFDVFDAVPNDQRKFPEGHNPLSGFGSLGSLANLALSFGAPGLGAGDVGLFAGTAEQDD